MTANVGVSRLKMVLTTEPLSQVRAPRLGAPVPPFIPGPTKERYCANHGAKGVSYVTSEKTSVLDIDVLRV